MALLPRFRRAELAVEDAAKVERVIAEAERAKDVKASGTAGGDAGRLRGIPAVARGVPGAIVGTRPGPPRG